MSTFETRVVSLADEPLEGRTVRSISTDVTPTGEPYKITFDFDDGSSMTIQATYTQCLDIETTP